MLPLRISVIALLVGLLVWPPGGSSPEPSTRTVRRATEPPSIDELERLHQLGRPIYAALPSASAILSASPPLHARQGRATSIAFQTRARPGSSEIIRLADAGGPLDSVTVTADADGLASAAIRVVPRSAGWQRWVLSSETLSAEVGTWVLPQEPLRVLVVSGPGSVEGRDVARALESSGASVTLAQSLGRGLTLGGAPAVLASDAGAMSRHDVVLVLGVPLTSAQASALTAWAGRGGGVLASGAAAATLPIVRAAESSQRQIPAAAITWSTPAEVPALPAVDLATIGIPLTRLSPAAWSAARSDGAELLVLGAVGRGRMGALALENTWIWGLQAGRGEELIDFWSGLADWLAGGSRAPLLASVDPASAAPGSTVAVTVAQLDPNAPRPSSVTIRRPDGADEALPLAWEGSVARATFVSDAAGTFVVSAVPRDGAAPLAAATSPGAIDRTPSSIAHSSATAPDPPSDAWARLALLANASGGAAVPSDSLEVLLSGLPGPGRPWPPPPVAWLFIAFVLALTEWAARRLRGLA